MEAGKRAPKILMVGPDLSMRGGIASVAAGLLDGGLSQACDLRYVATACEGFPIAKAARYALGLTEVRNALKWCDVVHIHVSVRGSFKRKYEVARLAKAKGKRLILHEHSGEFAEVFESAGDAYRDKVREFFDWADAVVVLSEEWRDYFAKNVCHPEKIVVMHNAVALPFVPADPYMHQDVLFLGRLGTCKSPDVLLHAAKALRPRFPGVRYHFGGDGDIETYKKMAEGLGVSDCCDFVGWVTGEEKEHLVRQSGVFCLPSRHEGMPMSLLEMMSYGLPCVATPVGGVPRVIQDGENGFMTPVGNEKALAACLTDLLNSPDYRLKIGVSARKTIEQKFNIEKNIHTLICLYEGVS